MILGNLDSHDSIEQVRLSLKRVPSNIASARHTTLMLVYTMLHNVVSA